MFITTKRSALTEKKKQRATVRMKNIAIIVINIGYIHIGTYSCACEFKGKNDEWLGIFSGGRRGADKDDVNANIQLVTCLHVWVAKHLWCATKRTTLTHNANENKNKKLISRCYYTGHICFNNFKSTDFY